MNIIFVNNYIDAAIHAAMKMDPPLIHVHGLRRVMVKAVEDFHKIGNCERVAGLRGKG